MNEYSIECIDKLRIHELRDFARNVGVSSPTTMKKEELIEKITEAVENNNKSSIVSALPKTRRGIDFFALLLPENNDLLSQMLGGKTDCSCRTAHRNSTVSQNIAEYPKDLSYDCYPEELPICDFNVAQNEAFYDVSEVIEGYLYIHNTGYGIVRNNGFIPSNRDVYLSAELVNKHMLKGGDKVKGRAKAILEDKPMIMFEVISVDGNPEQSKVIPFDTAKHNGLGDSFYFDRFNVNIKKGERVYIKNLDYEYAIKMAEDLLDEGDLVVKVLNVRAVPEDEKMYSRQRLDVVSCPFNMGDNNVVATLDLMLDRIKREFEDGRSNVLIIYNFSGLLRVLNTAIDGFLEYDKFDMRAVNKVLDIMYSAKYTDNNHHFSVIFVDKKEINPVFAPLYSTEFQPLFNKEIDASELGFFN